MGYVDFLSQHVHAFLSHLALGWRPDGGIEPLCLSTPTGSKTCNPDHRVSSGQPAQIPVIFILVVIIVIIVVVVVHPRNLNLKFA